MAIRFPEEKVRGMGRTAYGVKGINLAKGDYCIGMVVVKRDSSLLVVTENGYGKRTSIDDYRMTNRGGKGVINVKTSERNGEVVSIKEVLDQDELILITKKGKKVAVILPINKLENYQEKGLIEASGALADLDDTLDESAPAVP